MLKSLSCFRKDVRLTYSVYIFSKIRFSNSCWPHQFLVNRLTLSHTFISCKRSKMDIAAVLKILENKMPPMLAEKWDNTGLLVEPSSSMQVSTIFFTNDLTEEVVKEAVLQKSDMIISYHPPIFSAIKALKQSNWKDRILMMCIQNNIAVYSPHTRCDALADGVNDWLINCFDISDVQPILQSYGNQPNFTHVIEFSCHMEDLKPEDLESVAHCRVLSIDESPGSSSVKAKVTESSLKQILKHFPNIESSMCLTQLQPVPLVSYGMGRKGKLGKPLTLQKCIEITKEHCNIKHIRFAKAVTHSLESPISVIAVCAGSGASVLKGVAADLYITGEMSHHDLLDATHRNVSVVLCEHSNSERGYLQELVSQLTKKLDGVKLIVSASDKDPISIL